MRLASMLQHGRGEGFMTTRHDQLALYAAHTVRPPKLGLSECARVLEELERKVKGQPAAEQRRMAADPTVRGAMLGFLAHRFTPLDLSTARSAGDLSAAMEAAGHVLMLSDAATHRRFLDEVIFNLAHPEDHRFFAPTLEKLIPVTAMESALLEHARGDNPLHQRNTFALLEHLQRGPRYRLSARGVRELAEVAGRLAKAADTNPELKRVAARFVEPSPGR